MAQVKGITIEIGADTVKFDEGIKGTKKALSQLGNEAKNINKQLKLDPNNVELLNKKLVTLNKQQELTTKKLEEYKKELASMSAEEVGSDKWLALQKAINNTETELAQFDDQIKKTQAKLDNIKINADNAQVKRALDEIKKEADATKDKLTKIGDGLENAGKKMLPITAGITAGLGYGVKGASDLAESLNKTEVAFGANSQAVIDFANNSATKFGQMEGDILDSAATFGLLGVSAEDSMTLVSRAVDLASISNKSFADVQADIQSAMNGSTEVMEKYGVKLKQVDLAQYLVENGIAGTTSEANKMLQAMDSNTKQMLMYEKIMSDTAYAQDDFNNTSDGFANSLRIVTAQLKTIATELGAVLLPIITKFLEKVKEWLSKFSELDQKQKEMIVTIALIVAAIGPLLIAIGNIVTFLAPVIASVQALFSAMSLLGGFMPALTALFPTLATAIGLVFSPIGAVIASIIVMYTQSEELRKFIDALISGALNVLIAVFNGLKDTIMTVVVPALMQLWGWFKDNIIPIVDRLFGVLNATLIPVLGVLANVIGGTVIPIIMKFWEWIASLLMPIVISLANVVSGVLSVALEVLIVVFGVVVKAISFVVDIIGQLWSAFSNTGAVDVIIGAFNTLKAVIDSVFGAISNVIGALGSVASKAGDALSKLNPFKSGGFNFDTGGFGFDAGGYGNTSLALTTNINVTNNGSNIGKEQIMAWGKQITDIVDENLGRRGR